jgi:signal transduction histidine kinase
MINVSVIFTVVIIIILIIIFIILLYCFFLQITRRRENRQHQLKIQHQKSILEQSIKTQESERKRIAALLHDDVGNKLNILSVWINNPDTWNNERSKQIITKLIPNIIETTRNISHSLYPFNLERLGLILTINELISNVESSLVIQFILIQKYKPAEFSIEVQLYRIIQEFLSNVLKHSGANKMQIHIRDSVKSLSILLSDNGKGFDIDSIKRGMGFNNIEFRLNSMNAAYKWKSEINKGCQLLLVIPRI